MYTDFFELSEKPFNLTPDPRFLYLSIKHREALAHLLFGIKSQAGFVLISGEIGTGKTTLCRSLLNQLDADTNLSFIFNPALSPEELLRNINEDFGILTTAATIKGLIDELNVYLLDQAVAGRKCVLVIDEAQNLKPEVLEQIRLLSNLETEKQKLIQIILIGQPELVQHLELPELRQLNQRITARCHLSPLNFSETLQYIAWRIRVAGGRGKVRFTRGAVRAVYRCSGGTPRMINAICDRALLIGYTKNVKEISKRIALQAAEEIRGEEIRTEKKPFPFRYFIPNPTIIATVVVVFFLVRYFTDLQYPEMREAFKENFMESGAAAVTDSATLSEVIATPPEFDVVELTGAIPVPPEPEPASPPAPKGIEQMLAMTPDESLNAASAALVEAWGREFVSGLPSDATLASLRTFAEENGLGMETIFPTLDQVLVINRKALLKVRRNDGFMWAGLVGYEDDRLIFASTGGETIGISPEDLERVYLQQAVILWDDPAPDMPILQESMESTYVARFKGQLEDLGWRSANQASLFDDSTVQTVRNIQRASGLAVDGVVGSQTRMVVSGWSLGDASVMLRSNDEVEVSRILSDGAVEPAPNTKVSQSHWDSPAHSDIILRRTAAGGAASGGHDA